MVLRSRGWIQKCIAVFMIIVILTPNVYCVEMSESSDSETTETSQVDTASEDDTSSASDDQSSEETLEAEEDSIEEVATSEATVATTSTSVEEIVPLVEARSYLDPTIEYGNDYFDTSLFTGSFIYTYPIETVAGKGGLEPKVTLTYSSSSSLKSTYGSLGAGWSLNDNCIIRDVRYTPGNTSDDRFILILDGSSYELVYVEEDGLYHTEIESFIKISRNTTTSNSFGEYWNVVTPEGKTYRFGYNYDSEQRNSVEARSYVSKWWLDLIEDVNGNQVQYNYVENPDGEEIGSTYLKNITYNDGLSCINFNLDDKTTTFDIYENGNRINERKIISFIDVINNDSLLWKYNLDYESSYSKLLLTSLTKIGCNNSYFPSTVFEYDSTTGWEQNNSWIPPLTFATYDRGHRFIDVNGDGLVDQISGYKNTENIVSSASYINNGNGWTQSSSWIPPTYFSYSTARHRSNNVGLGDVNGDGLVDILRGGSSTWINNGTDWEINSSWVCPESFGGYDLGVRVVDVNGDGLDDILKGQMNSEGTITKTAWINNGHGWEEDSTWTPPTYFAYNTQSRSGLNHDSTLTDVNGDNLVDIVVSTSIWINNGSGWEQNNEWNFPLSFGTKDYGVRLADVNGDGLIDVLNSRDYDGVDSDYKYAWLNTGSGWVEDSSWAPTLFFGHVGFYATGANAVDVNGDGLVDLVQRSNSYGSSAWINTNKDTSDGYIAPYLLKNIQHQSGANTTIKYEPSTNFDNTGNDDISDLPVNMWVTSQIRRDNGIEGTGNLVSTTNYSYKDGMQYYDAPEEIEFRGFGEVTVENNYSITKHTFHQDDILKGIENHNEVWDKEGNLYSSSDMEYSKQGLYSDVNLILLENESSTQFDGLTQSLNDPIGWSSFKEYNEYDNYGNPLSVTEHGDVDVTGDERYLNYEYVNDEDDWIIGKTAHEWIEDDNHVNCSESWCYYDDTGDNSDLDRGLLTKVVSWNNNGDNPSVQYDYDNYGNIIEITDVKGNSQTISYDENHVYPVSIENSLGQKESYEYNDLGRITKVTDSNGISTEYAYDDLHRLFRVIKPYDDACSPSIEYNYEQDGKSPEILLTKIKEKDSIIETNTLNNSYCVEGTLLSTYKDIQVSPSSETLTDYPMCFNITYEPEMQSDFDDLRFVGIPKQDDIIIDSSRHSVLNTDDYVLVSTNQHESVDGNAFRLNNINFNVMRDRISGTRSIKYKVTVTIPSYNNGEETPVLQSYCVSTSNGAWYNINYDCNIESEYGEDVIVKLYIDSSLCYYACSDEFKTSCDVLLETFQLPYWIQEKEDSGFANVWVKVPEISSVNGTTVKVYYGNSDICSKSNGYNVFELFDSLTDTELFDYIDAQPSYLISTPYHAMGRNKANSFIVNNTILSTYKNIQIEPSSEELIDYPMYFNVNYESGMQPDFEDLRFVYDDGTVLLNISSEDDIVTDSSQHSVLNTDDYVLVSTNQHESVDGNAFRLNNINFNVMRDRISGTRSIKYKVTVTIPSYNNGEETTVLQSYCVSTSNGAWYNINYDCNIESEYGEDVIVKLYIDSSLCYYACSDEFKTSCDVLLGTPQLSYWIEEKEDSNYADVWVKVPAIDPIVGANVKMYYGNSSILSESNGYNVFESFDDLNETAMLTYMENEPLYNISTASSKPNKTILIMPSKEGTLEDYPLCILINHTSGMQKDFDDIRFTDNNGNQISYWIENAVDFEYAKIWLSVPKIDPARGAVVKMYYGNPIITSESNAEDVFLLYDDFDGSQIDAGKWIVQGSGTKTLSNGILMMSGSTGSTYSESSGDRLKSVSTFGNDTELVVKYYQNYNGQNDGVISYNANCYDDYIQISDASSTDSNISYITQKNGLESTVIEGSWTNDWIIGNIKRHGSETTLICKDANESTIFSETLIANVPLNNYPIFIGGAMSNSNSAFSMDIDYVIVRKCTSSIPAYFILESSCVSSFITVNSYDGLGNIIQKISEGENGFAIQNIAYNDLGLSSSTEVPHYMNESIQPIIYQYDAAGRPTVITNTDNTTLSYRYELANTTITNQNGVNKTLTSDIYGNIAKVYEFNEGETYVTSYSYDAMNNLVEIIPGILKYDDSLDFRLSGSSNSKTIIVSPSSDGTLTDYQMSFNISYEPEMQADFDDIRFTDENNVPLSYWIESITNSHSAKVWVKVPEINATNGATVKMYYGNSTLTSESNGNDVFEFFDDFSSSLDPDKWTTVYNTPNGGSCDVTTEDGKLKVSVRGPSYAVQADAYAKTQASFNFENTPLEIEYSADQVISSGEGAWWYSGFILSNDTTMPSKYCGGSYVPDNGIAIRQPLDGYGSTGTAINVNSYVDSSSTSIYHTSNNPGTHKFNLIMDKENVTLYVDDEVVAEDVNHNLTEYDSYIYFLRSSDQYIWNTQKWDYVIVRQHATDEPTYTISENIEEISFSNNKSISILPSSDGTLTDYQMSFNISYEPEMQADFDDIRFTDENNVPLSYWIESITNSHSSKVWVKVPEINATNGATVKMYYGNSTLTSESNGNDVFEFFDDFSSSLDTDKWTTVYNTPNGGSCDVTTEDGKLKVSVRGPSYAVQADAYAKTQASFNFGNTPLEIEYSADQVISSGEGAWWYSGFILSNDTTMPSKYCGGSYVPDNGIAIRQPLDGYGSTGTAINVNSYVDSSSTSIYHTSNNPGTHKFNLIMDKENVTLYVDDEVVAEDVNHNLTEYDSYIYFLRSSDQYIWNTQKWDYVIVRQHATDEPTYTISENIEEISFSNGGRVTFTYDSLGRKIAMNDPDMGNWTYEYDLNGNLINQTDARGISTLLSYDALDRLTAIDYPNDDDISFTYDLEYNGTLSRVTKGVISSIYDYDDRYRVEGETIGYVPGTSGYTTSYEYDSMDRPTTITYPDGNSVDLTYNAQTLLESVEGVVDNLDYNARNQITTKELSNGVVTTYTYDAEKLLLDRIYTESLQDLNYEFDNVGNILEIEDNVMNSVKTYGYDDLDRLTSADMSVNSVSTYQRDFSYDQYGCIQQVDENGVTISSYGYASVPFHAPVTYNGNDLVYDANGNLVEDEDFTYTYNDANQLSEVLYAANESLVEKYWYDANGQRVKKQNSAGELTYYVNQFYEIENGTATSYFFRDDERIAKETSGDMEWYLSDHLGSTTLLINESRLEVERTEYYPYGEVQSGGLEKYGFTGQENDVDTELMYYGARYYSPEYRVFVQPDTMLPDVYDPQALNRYAYCLNNPVKYTDPSGHCVTPETALDLICLGHSIVTYMDNPNMVNGAFLAWDAIATLVPLLPASYLAKAPRAIRAWHASAKIHHGVEGVSYGVYKGHSFIANSILQGGLNIYVDGGYTESSFGLMVPELSIDNPGFKCFQPTFGSIKIDNFLEGTFGTDSFNNINHEGWLLTLSGRIIKDNQVLIDASSRSVNVLIWQNLDTGSITIEEIESSGSDQNDEEE